MNEARAVKLISDAFRCGHVESEHSYSFTPRSRTDFSVDITKSDLGIVISALDDKATHSELSLSDEKTLEILVREEGYGPARSLRGEDLAVRDDDNGVSYEVAGATDPFILFFLDRIAEHSDSRYFLRGYPSSMWERRMEESETPMTVFDVLRAGYLRIKTVRVRSDAKASTSRMSTLANAFLFQLAYNTDIALVPQRELDAFARAGRISRMRRNRANEIDAPRRTYNPDLIHHYLLAISTDNPVVEYLSHYHTLEHFYESVFHDDLISSIQSQITEPSFSYRRKKDIRSLIKTIRKSLKIQDDTITFSEEQALRLTLERFVRIDDLVADLDNYDDTLIPHYQATKVGFAHATEIDLSSADHDVVIKKLSKRIYATRNALVHSKDGDKAKYTPFVDDHELAKELPLLRFIAERTILANSTMVE